jgi:hypothetical protein
VERHRDPPRQAARNVGLGPACAGGVDPAHMTPAARGETRGKVERVIACIKASFTAATATSDKRWMGYLPPTLALSQRILLERPDVA